LVCKKKKRGGGPEGEKRGGFLEVLSGKGEQRSYIKGEEKNSLILGKKKEGRGEGIRPKRILKEGRMRRG